MVFSNAFSCVVIQISLFLSYGLVDNKSPLFQSMAWHRTGNKPSPESMMIQFTDIHASQGLGKLTH